MINEDRLPRTILLASVLLLALTTAVAYLNFPVGVGNGVLAGGAIAIINFAWQGRTLRRLLGGYSSPSPTTAVVRYLLRLSVTGIALYFLLTSGTVSILALLAGLSIIVAVIVLITLYSAFNKGD